MFRPLVCRVDVLSDFLEQRTSTHLIVLKFFSSTD